MKKVIFILSTFLIAAAGDVSAQVAPSTGGSSAGEVPMDQISLNFTKVEGPNTVPIPKGRGTIKFVARGDKFSDVVFIDAAGKSSRLIPGNGPSAGAPNLPCKYPIPDACFGTANKNVGMCMCRPTDLSAGGGGDPNAILIGLLLPAVQKVREAAH
jgi:hypothetical protein